MIPSRSSPRIPASLALALAVVLGQAALGQGSTLRRLELSGTPPQFQERFNRTTLGVDRTVTGSELRTIVGLQFGQSRGRFDMSAVLLAMPAERAAASVCVKVSSADGRYMSANTYRLPAGGGTFGLDTPTRYRGELSSTYGAREMIVLAMMSPNCVSPSTALFLPALAPQTGIPQLLTVYVNAPRDRVLARLRDAEGRTLTSVACRDMAGRAVAYTAACPLSLGATATTNLSLEIFSRTGKPPLTYAIQLPARIHQGAD